MRILSGASAISRPIVRTPGQAMPHCSHHGASSTRTFSQPGLGNSVRSRRISARNAGGHSRWRRVCGARLRSCSALKPAMRQVRRQRYRVERLILNASRVALEYDRSRVCPGMPEIQFMTSSFCWAVVPIIASHLVDKEAIL